MKKIANLKFNVIDFLIIIVILAIIVSVVFRRNLFDKFNTEEDTITYTLKIENTTQDTFDFLDVGGSVYVDGDVWAGTITDKSKENAIVYDTSETGEIKKVVFEDRIDIYLEVEALGVVDEQGKKLNGKYFIAAGKTMTCRTDKIEFSAEVRDVLGK